MNEATYSCNTGFNVVGESVRRCLASAMWSGSAPECERKLVDGCLVLHKSPMQVHDKALLLSEV